MGQPDLFAKRTFAKEIPRITGGAVRWKDPPEMSWPGEQPLWLVAPHVPEWLREARQPLRFAAGCYRVEPLGHCFLWIAANEFPLQDELVPFLVARSGLALDQFVRWVAPRRPLDWVLAMLKYLPMSTTVRDELFWRLSEDEGPEYEEREQYILEGLLKANPRLRQRLFEKDRLAQVRADLRRVLERRQLTLTQDDEQRIEACADLATLERWHDQAVTAASASEALR